MGILLSSVWVPLINRQASWLGSLYEGLGVGSRGVGGELIQPQGMIMILAIIMTRFSQLAMVDSVVVETSSLLVTCFFTVTRMLASP